MAEKEEAKEAAADQKEATEAEGEKKPAKSKKKLIIIIAALVLVLAGGGIGAKIFLGKKSGTHAAKKEVAEEKASSEEGQKEVFYEMTPPFIVNMSDDTKQARYLQIGVVLVVSSEEMLEVIKANDVLIKNTLVSLYSDREYNKLNTREGKEEIRQETFNAVKKVMTEKGSGSAIKGILFSSFVMQ